jgi:osmotically inducible protein OsmC
LASVVRQTARVVWEGSIARGAGVVRGASGATGDLEFDLPNRLGEAEGKTTPEELLAAAHAACFTMTLGSILARKRTPPERLEVDATCVLDPTEGARKITAIELDVRGHVPDADADGFARAAKQAEETCVVSRALGGNVEIRATATLR